MLRHTTCCSRLSQVHTPFIDKPDRKVSALNHGSSQADVRVYQCDAPFVVLRASDVQVVDTVLPDGDRYVICTRLHNLRE
jgi:hypothetical protein